MSVHETMKPYIHELSGKYWFQIPQEHLCIVMWEDMRCMHIHFVGLATENWAILGVDTS